MDAGAGVVLDPFGGRDDLEARLLRTVGDARERFAEDALRLVRAARFAGRFEMTIDPATAAALGELAPTVASVSAERVRDELLRILRLDVRPSHAFLLLERFGLLAVLLPELAALRGIPQHKATSGDALEHTLAAVDAAPMTLDGTVRLAALLHDLGKATTRADGHFIGHELVGADLAAAVLRRLRIGGTYARIPDVIRQHMYAYDETWTDAAVRRFIHRLEGIDRELLFALRRADNRASGAGAAGEANQDRLEARIRAELEGQPDMPLRSRLAVDGHDLQRELGISAGPEIGRMLDRLVEAVLEDPTRNERNALLDIARQAAAQR